MPWAPHTSDRRRETFARPEALVDQAFRHRRCCVFHHARRRYVTCRPSKTRLSLTKVLGGGIMASGTESTMTLGENIIITGLVVQIFFFTCFVITAGLFHYRMKCCPTAKSIETSSLWKRSIHSLYVGSVLIWVRCVFRLIEYAQGNDGYLMSHEVFLYVFDATLMCGVMVLFAVVHPSEINARLHGPGWKVVENGIFLHSTQGA